jgi:uncharacterized protein YndB with AHSA1/START domain
MTGSDDRVLARVTHRFDAAAERVYDGFLDPSQASRFMFATATGQIVRCDIDARVGGPYTIVDRRNGEDVVHTGTYLALERPRRIVFTLSVETYSKETDTVTIEIARLRTGCEVTLTHEMKAKYAPFQDRAREGWTGILAVAAELLVDEPPTCGVGLAQHATIPANVGVMFEGLAETLELHRRMLVLDDPNSRREDEVYRELAASWKDIAQLVEKTAAHMAVQHELPMGAHDQTAWGEAHLKAFEKFVKAQTHALALLRVAAERDERMLASVRATLSQRRELGRAAGRS